MSWGLFVDANQPERFVEHLRPHERMIASDMIYGSRARSYQLGDAPSVTHLISANAVALHNPGSFMRAPATENADQVGLKKVLP